MNVFNLFRRRGSAPVARERLQILLSYERAARGQSDLLAILREDILAALTKHITVERENVQVRMDRGESVSTLEIEVEIPNSAGMLLASTLADFTAGSGGPVTSSAPKRARVSATCSTALAQPARCRYRLLPSTFSSQPEHSTAPSLRGLRSL